MSQGGSQVMRVYVPLDWQQLTLLADGEVDVERGHAVTDDVRRELEGVSDEELEYAVQTAAAADAVALVTPDHPLRAVAAADVAATPDVVSEVVLDGPLRLADVEAVLVDLPDAVDDVAASAAAPEDDSLLERALEHDLGWYAVQELDALLEFPV